jgi:hypothetical protein
MAFISACSAFSSCPASPARGADWAFRASSSIFICTRRLKKFMDEFPNALDVIVRADQVRPAAQ